MSPNRRNIPTTYDEARKALVGRTSRAIAHNTSLVVLDDCIGLRLHSTYVVRFYPDGRVTLHTGSWRTVTTKDRLNRVALAHGWRVYSVKRVWKVARFGRWHEAVDFEDGFTLGGEHIPCADCGTDFDDSGKASRGLPPLCGRCFTGRLARGAA